MKTFINLVATRCKNGDHTTLLRWYNDHVHILMGFDGLQRAALYRCAADCNAEGDAAAPEYICLYDFASQADFNAFEVGSPREQARQILLGGWGKDGIEITQRSQFRRLGARVESNSVAASDGLWHVQSLRLGAGPVAGVARWLGDSLHRALDATSIAAATGQLAWHRAADANDAGGGALVMVQTENTQALAPSPLPPDWWLGDADNAGQETWGQAPASTAIAWAAPYRQLCVWGR